MYTNPFYIDTPHGNNIFSFDKRENKKIFVPSLKQIEDFGEIQLGSEIAFEDYDFNDQLSSCTGLKNFYEICRTHPDSLLMGERKKQKIFLFDNHNHAFYFWYLARNRGVIGDHNTLIHIDEHADTRDNGKHLLKPESYDLEKVFHFTNYILNVGDYIIPAQEEGIIGDIIQIRNEQNLFDYCSSPPAPLLSGEGGNRIVLNLDLDFFQPDLDFIDYDLKKKVVLDATERASVITVATSPFFIDQTLALKVFKDIFF